MLTGTKEENLALSYKTCKASGFMLKSPTIRLNMLVNGIDSPTIMDPSFPNGNSNVIQMSSSTQMDKEEITSVCLIRNLEDSSSPCRVTATWFSTIIQWENLMKEKLSGLPIPMEKVKVHTPASCSKMETLSFMTLNVNQLGPQAVMENANTVFWLCKEMEIASCTISLMEEKRPSGAPELTEVK